MLALPHEFDALGAAGGGVRDECRKVLLFRMAIPPKATWERPSPMKEKRFSTSVTPSSEEHSAISVPTISAYCTKGNCR